MGVQCNSVRKARQNAPLTYFYDTTKAHDEHLKGTGTLRHLYDTFMLL